MRAVPRRGPIAKTNPNAYQGFYLAVYFSSVTNLYYQNNAQTIADRVNHSIVSLADSVLLFSRQFFASVRSRLAGKLLDLSRYFDSILARQCFEFSDGGGLYRQVIFCHGVLSLLGRLRISGSVLSFCFRMRQDLRRPRSGSVEPRRSQVPTDFDRCAQLSDEGRGERQDQNKQ